MVKVLHIIPTLGIGGTERQLVRLLPRMDRGRFQQAVCFYTPSESLETTLHEAGIETVFFDKFSMSSRAFFGRLRCAIREAGPDIVHTWLYSANFWGRLAALTCGVRRLVASDRSIAGPAPPHVRLYEKCFAPLTTRLANSRAVAASLERQYGLPAARTQVIYNAVDQPGNPPPDVRAVVRDELGLPARQYLVLMACRQTPEKNHAMYFRAARRVGLCREDVTFVVLGHLVHPDELHAVLGATGAAPHARIVNQRDDVPRWLAAADLFCLTSDEEGLPNVVLEAMAAGLPVVCTDFESAREVVTDGVNGAIVPRSDDERLAGTILALLDDEVRRRALGSAARGHVRRNFDWDRLVGEMEALYERLVEGDGGRAA